MLRNTAPIMCQKELIAPAVDNLMNPLDGKTESTSNRFQSFASTITLTNDVVAFFFGNMLFGGRLLGQGNA